MEADQLGSTRKFTINNVDFFCDGLGPQHFKAFGHCLDNNPQYDATRPIEYWKAQLVFRGFSPKGHSIEALKLRLQAANTNTMDQKVAAAYSEENTTGRKRKRRADGGIDPTSIVFPFESSSSVKQEPRNQRILADIEFHENLDFDYDDTGVTQDESVPASYDSLSPRSKKARADHESRQARCETVPDSPHRPHQRHSPPHPPGPSEPQYDELTDIYKGEKVSELARVMWAERDPVRTIEHRNPNKLLNLSSRANYESAIAYLRGDIAQNPCETCDPASGRSRGPFRQCVIWPGKFSGACCNCRYNKKGDSCSSHELNVNPEARAARAKLKGKGRASSEHVQDPAVIPARRSATAAAIDSGRSRSKSRDVQPNQHGNGEGGSGTNLDNGFHDTENFDDDLDLDLPQNGGYNQGGSRPMSRSTSSSIPAIRTTNRQSRALSEEELIISYPLTGEHDEETDNDQSQAAGEGIRDEVITSQEGIRDMDISDDSWDQPDEIWDITGKWEIKCPQMAFSFGQDAPYLLSIYTSDRRLGRETYGRFDLDQVSGVFRFSAGTYGDDDYENETDEFLLDPGDTPSASGPSRSYRWRGIRGTDGAVQVDEDKKLYTMTFSHVGNRLKGTWGTWQGAFGRLEFTGKKIAPHRPEESMHIQQAWKELDG